MQLQVTSSFMSNLFIVRTISYISNVLRLSAKSKHNTNCMYFKRLLFSKRLDVVSSYRILGPPPTCSRHLLTRLPGQPHPQLDEIHGPLRGQLQVLPESLHCGLVSDRYQNVRAGFQKTIQTLLVLFKE